MFVLWDNCLLATLGKSYPHVLSAFSNGTVVICDLWSGSASGFARGLSGALRARPVERRGRALAWPLCWCRSACSASPSSRDFCAACRLAAARKVKGGEDGWLTQWIKLWTLHYPWLGAYGISPAALQGAGKAPSVARLGQTVCAEPESTLNKDIKFTARARELGGWSGHRRRHSHGSLFVCLTVCLSQDARK